MSETGDHVVVTGGAGFIGIHLCAALLSRGAAVTAIDNLSAGHIPALDQLLADPRFTFLEEDVSTLAADRVAGPVTRVVHLATPIGPDWVRAHPVETLLVNSAGTVNVLELARRHGARIVVASSSEIYGTPTVWPQPESYFGNVDPTGPLSGYTEGKRFVEAVTTAYQREYGVSAGIVRPFNIYGPGAAASDRRVVPAFVSAALDGGTLTLHGGGESVRSFCYVEDFVAGLLAVLDSDLQGPVNLGSDQPVTMAELARLVVDTVGSGTIEIAAGRPADAAARYPDTGQAARLLGWRAATSLADGIAATVEAMRAARDLATIKVPAAWKALVGSGLDDLTCPADTVREALAWLAGRYPVLRDRLLDNDGNLVTWTNVFVGDTDIRDLDGVDTTLARGASLVIVPAVAGG